MIKKASSALRSLTLSITKPGRVHTDNSEVAEAAVLMEESTTPGASITKGEEARLAEPNDGTTGSNKDVPEATLVAQALEGETGKASSPKSKGKFVQDLGLHQTPSKYAAAVQFSHEVIGIGKEIREKAIADGTGPRELQPSIQQVDDAGGRDHFVKIFQRFYERLLADPLMRPIFNESPEERPPTEHGTLLGAFLLMHIGHSTALYFRVRHMGYGLGRAHYRAKQCPHRPAKHQGRGFTFDQGYAWLGNLYKACNDTNTSEEFRDLLLRWVASIMDVYAPFIKG